jgi:hypothetical protein
MFAIRICQTAEPILTSPTAPLNFPRVMRCSRCTSRCCFNKTEHKTVPSTASPPDIQSQIFVVERTLVIGRACDIGGHETALTGLFCRKSRSQTSLPFQSVDNGTKWVSTLGAAVVDAWTGSNRQKPVEYGIAKNLLHVLEGVSQVERILTRSSLQNRKETDVSW